VAKNAIPKTAKDLSISEAIFYSWRAKLSQGSQPIENQKITTR
jgi:transposase-like protein